MTLHDFRYPDAERYRNVPEDRIVRFLCSPFELAAGQAGPETEAMQRLLDHLVASGLPCRQHEDGSRRFDLAEVVNFIKFAHHAWGEPIWLERGVATMRRLARLGDPGDTSALPPDLRRRSNRFAVTITRRFRSTALSPGVTVRLNLPKPLNAQPGTHRLTWLNLDGALQDPVDEGSRYSVKVQTDGSTDITVAVRHEFVPAAQNAAVRDADAQASDLYLRPREGLVVVTPRIQALAEQLGLSPTDPGGSLRRVWDYLFDQMSFGFIHYDRLAAADPLAWGLDNQRLDCRTGSALIVAVCRAAGIPARMINGYTLHPALATSHSWAEIWFAGEGWRPFDTYAIDLAGDVRGSPWRDYFFGQIDDRFVAEILPQEFCGLGTPRLPASWQLSCAITDAGATSWFQAVGSDAVIYSESIAVALL